MKLPPPAPERCEAHGNGAEGRLGTIMWRSSFKLADMDSRLTEIEIKLSYAEDLLETLNRTVYRQQEHIDLLERRIEALSQQVRQWAPDEPRDPREDIPPHY